MYFLGVSIDGTERLGALADRNSKSKSENALTSESYNFCTAPMQSVKMEPVPIHVGLSVHWLPFSRKLVVKLRCGRLTAALDTRGNNGGKRTGSR